MSSGTRLLMLVQDCRRRSIEPVNKFLRTVSTLLSSPRLLKANISCLAFLRYFGSHVLKWGSTVRVLVPKLRPSPHDYSASGFLQLAISVSSRDDFAFPYLPLCSSKLMQAEAMLYICSFWGSPYPQCHSPVVAPVRSQHVSST